MYAVPFAALAAFMAYFFRDPDRRVPADPAGRVAGRWPGDGAGPGEPDVAPPGNWQQISIFLSPVDVHINRAPYGGRVTRVEYRPGKFLPAYKAESARENERTEVWIERDGAHDRRPSGGRRARPAHRLPRHGGGRVVRRRALRADEIRLAHGRLRGAGGDDWASRPADRCVAARRSSPDSTRARQAAYPRSWSRTCADCIARASAIDPAASAAARTCCRACSRWQHVLRLRLRGLRDARRVRQAALFIGFAFVLDMLDGRVARMTGTTSAFGVEFDSLADVISFGMAPAILAFAWGLQPFGRLGWAAGFIYVSAAAIRLARFNIQSAEPPTSATSSGCRARLRRACPPRRSSRIPTACRTGGRCWRCRWCWCRRS